MNIVMCNYLPWTVESIISEIKTTAYQARGLFSNAHEGFTHSITNARL